MGQRVLVTGGAGYIGSHTCLELLNAGHEVVVLDNLANSSEESLRRVQELCGKSITFAQLDLLDAAGVDALFATHQLDAVMHFAGLKAVGESNDIPLHYYSNNITGTLHLLEAMKRHGVWNFIFSSSATVYGVPESVPITEEFALSATNPYGRTKLMIEEILRDVAKAEPQLRAVLLRYFNPIGAHESGRIGEDPQGLPNNLMPFVMQVAVGLRDKVAVFGDDYDTRDGTGVRDYIHVTDLALGHLAALDALPQIHGCVAYNLGTGTGYSVLEMVRAAAQASERTIPHEVVARRAGDVGEVFADASRAARDLGWRATRDLQKMCEDSWRWQSKNPSGYKTQ